jgi:zinc transporter ZupT
MPKLLWTGTAEAAAFKLSSLFAVLAFGLCVLSAWVPYSLLHRKSTPFRTVLAYLAGFTATVAVMVAALLYLDQVEKVPAGLANDGVFRNSLIAFVGPAIGIWMARKKRTKQLHKAPKTAFEELTGAPYRE